MMLTTSLPRSGTTRQHSPAERSASPGEVGSYANSFEQESTVDELGIYAAFGKHPAGATFWSLTGQLKSSTLKAKFSSDCT